MSCTPKRCVPNVALIPKSADPDGLFSSPVCPRPGGTRGTFIKFHPGHRHVINPDGCPFPVQDEDEAPFLDETDDSIICDDLVSGGVFCADVQDEMGESILDETDGSVICDDLIDIFL